MFWLPRGGWRDSRTDWQRCLRGRKQTDLPWEGAFGFPEFSLRLQDRVPLQAVSAPRMPSVVCWVPLASQGTTLLGRLSCFYASVVSSRCPEGLWQAHDIPPWAWVSPVSCEGLALVVSEAPSATEPATRQATRHLAENSASVPPLPSAQHPKDHRLSTQWPGPWGMHQGDQIHQARGQGTVGIVRSSRAAFPIHAPSPNPAHHSRLQPPASAVLHS